MESLANCTMSVGVAEGIYPARTICLDSSGEGVKSELPSPTCGLVGMTKCARGSGA